MTHLLVDTSVVIKWFHAEGEREVDAARALLAAHVAGEVEAHVIDLAYYELGNVLLRSLHWKPAQVADQLDDVTAIVGAPIAMTPAWFRRAAQLGRRHGLSFYDASWAAAADQLNVALVSADRQLVASGLAESASTTAQRLRLGG